MAPSFSSAFDSGNGTLVALEVLPGGEAAADVAIVPDPYCAKDDAKHFQWFHFKLAGLQGVPCTIRIVNASGASYVDGWTNGYKACVSSDRAEWTRVATTSYEDGALVIRHTPSTPVTWYAYFAPYSHERLMEFVARCAASPRASLTVLGKTLDGYDLEMITVGTPGPGKRVVWVTCRQHPGESMASWWAEGFLGRLLDEDDALAAALLDVAVVHVVPNMNPDGSRRGHLRTNASGANLNREWAGPTLEESPEVFHVLAKMDETGMDFGLDVHGDEALPYNFIAGGEGVPSWNDRLADVQGAFGEAYERACPDFQRVHGYPQNGPGEANLRVCSNQLAERFGCVAVTLEQPFHDNANRPDPTNGWSPAKCEKLGAAAVDALVAVAGSMRPS